MQTYTTTRAATVAMRPVADIVKSAPPAAVASCAIAICIVVLVVAIFVTKRRHGKVGKAENEGDKEEKPQPTVVREIVYVHKEPDQKYDKADFDIPEPTSGEGKFSTMAADLDRYQSHDPEEDWDDHLKKEIAGSSPHHSGRRNLTETPGVSKLHLTAKNEPIDENEFNM